MKYCFQYVDRIDRPWRPAALAFGSSVHAAAEWLRKEQLAGRVPDAEAVLAVFDADWYAQNVEPLVIPKQDSKESLGAKGRAMFRLYTEHALSRTPKSAEKRFTVDLARTVRLVEGVASAIEAGHFFPNPSWRCTECEYYPYCQRWRGRNGR